MMKSSWRLLIGPCMAVVAFLLAFYHPDLNTQAATVAAITALCACWWTLEPIPIPATSIIPLALLPLLGILTAKEVAEAYGNPLILLLMGGCILSTAMEKSGAHRHIALKMLHLFGGRSLKRVVFGFMASSALLSMWISNTATTLMLLPVALAILSSTNNKALAAPLLLGICYSASIGGMGTPIGTPPNLILMRVYEDQVGESVSFLTWMFWCVPVVFLFVPLAGLWLTRNLSGASDFSLPEKESWTIQQKRVMTVFCLTGLAWITRQEPFGGWSTLLGVPNANDASIVLIAVVAMFIVPDGKQQGEKLLDWETAVKIPWGMLLLFSGGIALAKGFVASGLAEFLAQGIAQLAALPLFFMLLLICLGVTFLTEVTSNTASTSLLMPVLAVAAISADTDPMLMMLPAALSASCAFMLPVATAPNAIIYGSGQVDIKVMVRTGIVLNIIGALIISFLLLLLL
ncbi:SLC13 family permease [Agarilytica rhodophyticola]|uniref:SLC13 family permease n=1 Tax=Agarilytica rhodophyticola TaxID=1737490 RepID=UPI001C200D78|nr:SLC13 family permease [Agarilytica rhodophyticola]